MAAPNSCDPCGSGCIPPKMSKDYWQQAVLVALCQIVSGVTPGGDTTLVQLPDVVKAFGFFTNAYQVLGLVDAEKKLSHIMITNNTDGDYAVSFNNSTEAYRVLANSYKVIDFDKENLEVAIDMYMKWLVAPSLGSVIIEAYYFA